MTKKPKQFFFSEDDIRNEAKKKAKAEKPKSKKKAKVFDCTTCGLDKQCKNPKMPPFGGNHKRIMLVGNVPDFFADNADRPFAGDTGRKLAMSLRDSGIDMQRDCVWTNAICCRTPKSRYGRPRFPNAEELRCCYQNLLNDIEKYKPQLIICFGGAAISAVLKARPVSGAVASDKSQSPWERTLHGFVFPVQEHNAWVGCTYHPADADRRENREDIFRMDMKKILKYVDKPLVRPLTKEGCIAVNDAKESVRVLMEMSKSTKPVAFDYETTCLSSYSDEAELLTVSLCNDVDKAYCIHLANPLWSEGIHSDYEYVFDALAHFLQSNAPKVVQNYYMEELWSREHAGTGMNNFLMDTMVTSHVINCRRGTTGLDFQAYLMSGHYYSPMVDKKDMVNQSFPVVAEYNNYDTRYTLMLHYKHEAVLNQPGNEKLRKFNDFFTESIPTLANMKERGLLVDTKALQKFDEDSREALSKSKAEIPKCAAAKRWLKEKGSELNTNSTVQLAKLFYEIYDVKQKRLTKKKNYCMDEEMRTNIREKTEIVEVRDLLGFIQDSKKPESLAKKIKEWRGLMDPNNIMHSTIALHVAESYRSASFDPNIQNIYKRDKELVKFRGCIIPLPGGGFLEVDYDSMEVRVIGMVSHDPALAEQIKSGLQWDLDHPEGGKNPFDPHWYWAVRLFGSDLENTDKDTRYETKNGFTFPCFYGADGKSIARFTGLPEDHCISIQKQFWEKYHYVKEWQLKTKHDYDVNGYVELVTGARRPGPLNLEKIFNTPIQGPAFHLLLDGLNRVEDILVEDGFKTRPISETHDSILFNFYPEEEQDVIDITNAVLKSKRFGWQGDIPLSVSWERGKNFYEMQEI